jgi:chitodextrinase
MRPRFNHVVSRSLIFGAAILLVVAGVPAASFAASIDVTWTAPGDDGDVGTADQYDIRYSESPITVGNWDQATAVTGEPSPQVAGTTETFTITGLLDNTTYYVAIKAADEASNWSPLSNVAQVSTGDATAPAAIADLSATTP